VATESPESSTNLPTSPPCHSSSIFCPRPSCWQQADALRWLSWNIYVAVHAPHCCWYFSGSCSTPSSRLSYSGRDLVSTFSQSTGSLCCLANYDSC
jgi:hypothetical protein